MNNTKRLQVRVTVEDKTYEEEVPIFRDVPPELQRHVEDGGIRTVLSNAIELLARTVPVEERVQWTDQILSSIGDEARRLVRVERVRAGFPTVGPFTVVTRVCIHPELTSDAVPYRIEGHGNGTATLHVSPALEVRALDLAFGPDRRTPIVITVEQITAALGGAS